MTSDAPETPKSQPKPGTEAETNPDGLPRKDTREAVIRRIMARDGCTYEEAEAILDRAEAEALRMRDA